MMQHILPRVMFDQVPAETIYDQIGHVLQLYRQEAEQLVLATCGPDGESLSGLGPVLERGGENPSPYIVGDTVRKVGQVQGRVLETTVAVGRVPGSEPLRSFYAKHVDPYLRAQSGGTLPLGSAARAAALFHEIKVRLVPEAHAVVDRLEELCDRRRQFDFQKRLHRWLHLWMGVHLGASVALFVLMIAHGYLALKYV
jgi:hypothetical protein